MAQVGLALVPIGALAAPLALPRLAVAISINPNPITITPDTFDDVASPSCADGHAAGKCSLRGAVLRANGDGGDNIQLLAGTYTLSIGADSQGSDDGSSGDLDLGSPTTISGASAQTTIIQPLGEWNDRILEADSPVDPPSYTFSNLTIKNGRDNSQFSETGGGGALNDGANVTFHNVVFDHNFSAGNGGGFASSKDGAVTITNSTFSNNVAPGNGGGLIVDGTTTVANTFANLFFTNNSAEAGAVVDSGGGAIYDGLSGTGSATFTDLMIVGNRAAGMHGGGIYDDSTFASGVPYTDLTLSGNVAFGAGGGLYTAQGHVLLTNATITGNTAQGHADVSGTGNGGGIALGRAGSVTINNATINGNQSQQSGRGGGLAASGNGSDTYNVHNTILFGNTKQGGVLEECFLGNGTTLTSAGYNLADDTTCGLTQPGDRQGSSLNPNLGPLQDNGGPADGAPGTASPTLTEALPAGSIAIDKADPDNSKNPLTDERHISRPQGPVSDIGAYEFVPPPAASPSPSPPTGLAKAGHAATEDPSPAGVGLLLMAVLTLVVLGASSLGRWRHRGAQ
jgi:hypothetical protein